MSRQYEEAPFDTTRYDEICRKGKAKRVIVNNNEFNSISEVSRYYKVSAWSVYHRCASSKWPEWMLLE